MSGRRYKNAEEYIKAQQSSKAWRPFEKINLPDRDAVHPRIIQLQKLEALPERTPEQKAERQEMIDSIIITKPEAILFLRHRKRTETESGLVTSLDSEEKRISEAFTGTVLKTNPFYEKMAREALAGYDPAEVDKVVLKAGDFIRYSVYSPYSFFSDYPEVQLIGWTDVLAILTKLPKDIIED